jgi:NADH-quinone oxidoreductase subunit G
VNDGRAPHLLMNIHDESEVNQPDIHLGQIQGPSHGNTFNTNNTHKA